MAESGREGVPANPSNFSDSWGICRWLSEVPVTDRYVGLLCGGPGAGLLTAVGAPAGQQTGG